MVIHLQWTFTRFTMEMHFKDQLAKGNAFQGNRVLPCKEIYSQTVYADRGMFWSGMERQMRNNPANIFFFEEEKHRTMIHVYIRQSF